MAKLHRTPPSPNNRATRQRKKHRQEFRAGSEAPARGVVIPGTGRPKGEKKK